jgi:hypothetical protein
MWKAGELSGQEGKKSGCVRISCKVILLVMGLFLRCSPAVVAQNSDSQNGDSGKSWSATTDLKTDSGNPTRTMRSHTHEGDRTVDVRSLQTRGADGNFNPYQDIETETVRVNATTTRTTTRTFVRDDSGKKTLFQVTQEEKRTLQSGNSTVVRTTSNPDANGRLQVVQQENQETRKSGPDVEETKTTIMLPGINGGLAPAMQTEERQKRSGNTVEIQKTTQLPDGEGKWQVAEVRHSTTKDEGKNRNREEQVSRPDLDGKMGEVTLTVEKESEDASGDRRKSEETYSIDQPGAPRDSSLHLVQRVTTTQRSNANGQQTSKVAEQTNPGDPGAGLWVTTVSNETVRLGPDGVRETGTVQMRDANGNLDVVSVDMTKADSTHAINVQIAAPKPK